MYGKCGAIADAEMTFNNTSVKHNVASWTALISAYAECGHGEKALLAYRQMQDEGVRPNEQSLVCALQVLTASNSVLGQSKKAKSWEIGQALHADAYTKSFASEELLGNVLVSMYGKHGVIEEAESVFTGLSQRSIVSWTAMLSAYVEQGEPERALQAYNQLQEDGYHPNEQTMVIALQACGMLAGNDYASLFIQQKQNSSMCLEICQSLHTDAERKCLVSDVFVSCALLNAYSKCGVLLRAQEVFCAQPCYDTASWNAMIAAHVEHNQGPIGLQLYGQMLDKGKMVDAVTLMNALQACNKACILEACRDLHFVIVSSGHDLSLLLVSSLIHVYGSCSSISDAESTHDGVTQADVVLWNACIASYAEAGSCEACSQNLENMVLADMQPDGITFASVISSCNHTGFVHEGTEYFKCMLSEYRLNPDLKHYAAIIDLLGRAGDFKRLENVLWRLPRQPDLTIWLCVLGSCYKHGNFKLGRFVLYNALGLESKIACAYNCAPGLAKN
ncbi:hypothetical protein KP509_05G023100 [Ceratopteris richardii]|nr:hypothetical protein KP509_05G023100 [Ceratopteris richardii]